MSVVELEERRGFKAVRHAEGRLAVTVFADVDKQQANANDVRAQLRDTLMPELATDLGLQLGIHRARRRPARYGR